MESRVGFWPRLGAYLIDLVLLLGVAFAAKGAIAGLIPDAVARAIAEGEKPGLPAAARTMMATMATLGVAASVLGPFYAVIEGLTGWSPGKLILGLRIVGEDGRPAPLPKLLARFAVKGSATLLTFAGVVSGAKLVSTVGGWLALPLAAGCLLVFRSSRQALHDLAAKTAVLRKSDLAP